MGSKARIAIKDRARPRPRLGDLVAGAERASAWRKYWLTDPLEGLVDIVIHYALRATSFETCSAIGAWLGARAGRRRYAGKAKRAGRALRELRPDLNDAEIDALIARMWPILGRAYTEFSVLDRLPGSDRVRLAGLERVQEAQAAGRPLLIAGVHLGNWELIMAALAHHGCEPWLIYQPPLNRFRHAIARRARMRAGVNLLPPWIEGALPAMRVLKNNGCLVMFIDEYVAGRVHGPFFGRPAAAAGNIANAVRFAAASGAAVFPAHCLRDESGTRFSVSFGPEIDFDLPKHRRGALEGETLLKGVLKLDDVFDPIVRAHPEQWLMLPDFRFDR